jgi:hypothetical protein
MLSIERPGILFRSVVEICSCKTYMVPFAGS